MRNLSHLFLCMVAVFLFAGAIHAKAPESTAKAQKPRLCTAVLTGIKFVWPSDPEGTQKVMGGVFAVLNEKKLSITFSTFNSKNRQQLSEALKGTPYEGLSGSSLVNKFYKIKGEQSWSDFVASFGFEAPETKVYFRWPESDDELRPLMSRILHAIYEHVGSEGLVKTYLTDNSEGVRKLLLETLKLDLSGEALYTQILRMLERSRGLDWKSFLHSYGYDKVVYHGQFPWPTDESARKEMIIKILQHLNAKKMWLNAKYIVSGRGSQMVQKLTQNLEGLPVASGVSGHALYVEANKSFPENAMGKGYLTARTQAGTQYIPRRRMVIPRPAALLNVETETFDSDDGEKRFSVFAIGTEDEDKFARYARQSTLRERLWEIEKSLNDFDHLIYQAILAWLEDFNTIDFAGIANELAEEIEIPIQTHEVERVYQKISAAMSTARGR